MIPQAKVNGEGVMSLAGQNNRFNAFFIDGANNNDILGLAVSGTNGGQTGSPPISIEAIEEIKVLLAPYDVQYGNFTGGSINAITRSGSNELKASAWYYFRNENLAGRSPEPIEKPGFPGTFYRPRLSHFFNQTAGAWVSGALVKNKLFYFALLEKQSEVRPQPFNANEYKGTSNQQQINALADLLRSKYNYDPGSFLETKDELKATRFVLKFDWNASIKNKFMLSYRYNKAERFAPRVLSSATSVFFSKQWTDFTCQYTFGIF
jgi:outer membrane receptor for Fe3+-dicitrate